MKGQQRLSFPLESVSTVADDRRFASLMEQFHSKPGVAYIAFTFHATAPLVNRKGMTITYPTHKKSIASAVDTLVDMEHEAEDLPTGSDKTNITGHICALYVDDTDIDSMGWLVDGVIPERPVLTRGIMALYDRVRTVSDIVKDIQQKRDTWYFSLEVGKDVPPPEIWVFNESEHEIVEWEQADDELRAAALEVREAEYNGKRVAYLMGGKDGVIPFIGGAITQYPAGYEQEIPGNELKYICNFVDPDAETQDSELRFAIYSKMDDVPSRLKTMDGVPLSLAQVNLIVKWAESIEADGKATNGWAVAKAQFKDLYTIRDGRWGKKQKKTSSMSEIPNKGGKEMPVTLKDEELAAKLKTAGENAVKEAIEKGKLVKPDGLFNEEQVQERIRTATMEHDREQALESLELDAETKDDLLALAADTEKYPYTKEGQEAFQKAMQRWAALAKKDEDDDPDPDPDKGTASTGKGDKDFDPGSGNDSNSVDKIKPLPRFGMSAN